MTKHFLTAVLLLMSLSVFAQDYTQSFGFSVGYANPVMRVRSGYNSGATALDQKTSLNGFNLSAVYETNIIKGFGLQMGLNYTFGTKLGKWTKTNSALIYPRQKTDVYMHQLNIPIDWQYKFTIAKGTYLLVYSGPTIGFGLGYSAKTKSQNTAAQDPVVTTKNYYTIDDDQDKKIDYSRINLTWGIGAGFQYKRYFLRGGYDFGIFNPYKDRFHDIHTGACSNGGNGYEWNRRGRLDQWSIKIGMFIWQD